MLMYIVGSLCDTHQVTAFVQSRIPSAKLQDDIGTEFIYALPVHGGEREKFRQLFEDLDANLPQLHVKSYGISDTTLKEVSRGGKRHNKNLLFGHFIPQFWQSDFFFFFLLLDLSINYMWVWWEAH